ncbi:MAG: hypothetical protein QW331_04690 [Candidatus Woesearchaeota archaeon]
MLKAKREVAVKTNIKSILSGKYVKQEGWEPNYVEIDENRISRVNIIATVIEKIPENKTIVVDDGSGKIGLRSFDDDSFLNKVESSDVVLIIGRPREFNNEKFIVLEIVKKIDPKWLKVRKLELKNKTQEKIKEIETSEEDIEENVSVIEQMIKKIREKDKGKGVDVEILINNQDDEKLIEDMISDGIIFEIKPGVIKILE